MRSIETIDGKVFNIPETEWEELLLKGCSHYHIDIDIGTNVFGKIPHHTYMCRRCGAFLTKEEVAKSRENNGEQTG